MAALPTIMAASVPLLAARDDGARIIGWLIGVAILLILGAAGDRKRRRRRRRTIDAFDRPVRTKGGDLTMAKFAESLGLALVRHPQPVVKGRYRGVTVSIDLRMRGSPYTRFRARPAGRLPGKVRVLPRTVRGVARFCRPTGDEEFDAEYEVISFLPDLAGRLLNDTTRLWFKALGNATAVVKKNLVEVQVPGIEKDLDRLRGGLELATELARAG